MTKKPPYKDEQWLEDKYWDEGLTQGEMASQIGVTSPTISKYMMKFDIPTRSSAESRHFREEGPHDDADWLNKMYHSESYTIPQIAEKADVSRGTIQNRMEEFDIETRTRGIQVSGDREKLKNEDWLRQKYIYEGMSVPQIGEELDVSRTPVRRHMIKYGIEFRSTSEANKLRHTPKGSKLRDEDWMRQKYKNEYWSTPDFADATGTTAATALRWLKEHDISIRPFEESVSLAKTDSPVPELYDEEYMRGEYVDKGKNTPEIADELGVSDVPVRSSLRRHGIELRTPGESLADGNVTPLLDSEWLKQEYVVRQRTIYDIGDQLEVAPSTVSGHLENHGFERRGGSYRPQNFSHKVRSEWEHEIANQLIQYGVEYEYEPKHYVVNYDDGARYTPDFVTDKFIIEVKGFEREGGNEAEKAKAAMEEYSEMEYVVIGAPLPCDHHFSFDNRHELRRLFE